MADATYLSPLQWWGNPRKALDDLIGLGVELGTDFAATTSMGPLGTAVGEWAFRTANEDRKSRDDTWLEYYSDPLQMGYNRAEHVSRQVKTNNKPQERPSKTVGMAPKLKKKSARKVKPGQPANVKKPLPPPTIVIQAPVAKTMMVRPAKPNISQTNKGILVSHREFLYDMTGSGSTAFSIFNRTMINPGDVSTFPWLSGLANRFSMFKVHRAKLMYMPECPTSTAGAVLLAFDADASVGISPNSKLAFCEYNDSIVCAPWNSQVKELNLPKTEKRIYFGDAYNSNSVAGTYNLSLDPNTVSCGMLFAAIQGVSASSGDVLGAVWLDISVELWDPVHHGIGTACGALAGTGGSGIYPFGNPPVATQYGPLVLTASGFNVTVYAPGSYYFLAYISTSSLATPTSVSGTNNPVIGTAQIQATSGGFMIGCTLIVRSGGTKLTINGVSNASGISTIRITPYDGVNMPA